MGNKSTKLNDSHTIIKHNPNIGYNNGQQYMRTSSSFSSSSHSNQTQLNFKSKNTTNTQNSQYTKSLNRNQQQQHQQYPSTLNTNIPNLVASPLTLKKSKQMHQNQNKINNIIAKTIDSTQQPSYHLSSKLYKPNSLLIAKPNTVNNINLVQNNNLSVKNVKKHASVSSSSSTSKTSSISNSDHRQSPILQKTVSSANLSPIKQVKILPTTLSNSKTNPNITSNDKVTFKSSNSKLNKRFGLSPRFKRKIVETIKHGVQSSLNQQHNYDKDSNQKFNQSSIFSNSRLFQALQSQWNLFSSIRLSKNNFNDENELLRNKNTPNRHHHHHRTETQATNLSISLQHNSFRYASRRKYKTQSLANPYRHANTNYPVYIHEALFMPEFSVKGQVTEADFEILDVISRGAFGHVIKVKKKEIEQEQEHEQIYAMKIMWKSQVIRDRALQQVKDEVTIAINCTDNPLIVKTWFYWQSKRFLYIITDYVENGELLSLWLKVHHFPERLVIIYAVEMSLVLDYLHKKGIMYRDIKMENILLDQRGHVQLIDFGLSKWVKQGDRTGTICGTIQYMAPEILGVEPYDHAVDWWSLGILIYALLSGEYPLNAAKDHIQMNERVSKHIFELDRTRGEYTEDACDLVRKLLRKNPQRRLKSLDDIKREPFFVKEVDQFVDNYLKEEKLHEKLKKRNKSNKKKGQFKSNVGSSDSDSENFNDQIDDEESSDQENDIDELDEHGCEDINRKKLMISENFWNPNVIMQSYSPLQLLFDEIYTLKQKQLLKKTEMKHAPTNQKQNGSLTASQNTESLSPQFIDDQGECGFITEKNSSRQYNHSFTQF